MAETLHHQPGRVAARPRALFQRLLARLDPRSEPRYIVNLVSPPPIQVDQKANRPPLFARNFLQKSPQSRARRFDKKIRREVVRQLRSVLEWVVFDSRLQKKVERIDCR